MLHLVSQTRPVGSANGLFLIDRLQVKIKIPIALHKCDMNPHFNFIHRERD